MGDWDAHHGTLTKAQSYGDPTTYELAAWWLRDCVDVQDWGCGAGAFIEAYERYLPKGAPFAYRGVDSSRSQWALIEADLTEYHTRANGIVLRHVLEHNYDWKLILDNAVASFTKRLAVVLFTPLVGETHVLHTEPAYGERPVIAFALRDLLPAFGEIVPDVVRVESPWSHFGSETLILAQRS